MDYRAFRRWTWGHLGTSASLPASQAVGQKLPSRQKGSHPDPLGTVKLVKHSSLLTCDARSREGKSQKYLEVLSAGLQQEEVKHSFSKGNWHHLSLVQSLSHVWLFVTPRTTAHQASLSFIISQSLLRFTSIEFVMLPNHLILGHPLLLWPSILCSIRVFSNELALHIRCPKYWSFSFSISPSSYPLGPLLGHPGTPFGSPIQIIIYHFLMNYKMLLHTRSFES